MRRVTITDIANKAGVTKASVSMVLNDKPLAQKMLKATRGRINAIAKELDYQPSYMAKSLSSGKTKTLGLIVGDIDTPYYAEMTRIALDISSREKHQLLISATQWNREEELKCLSSMMQRQVDGIIFCTSALTTDSDIYKRIVKNHFPVVLYNTALDGISSVYSCLKKGMHDAIQLLAANDHRKVAYLGQVKYPNNKQGEFYKQCLEFGIEPVFLFESDLTHWGKKAFEKLKKFDDIKAVVVFADHMAQQLIGTMMRNGISVPNDYDVLSIDGTDWGAYGYPALTSIKQDSTAIMEKSIELLLNPPATPVDISIPTTLLIRESVKIK